MIVLALVCREQQVVSKDVASNDFIECRRQVDVQVPWGTAKVAGEEEMDGMRSAHD